MLKQIGERVRGARLSRHMSQAQLAAAIDVSVPYISHIEQGKQAMSIVEKYGGDSMKALYGEAERMGVDPQEILNMLK